MIKIIEHDGSVNEYDEKDAKVLSTLRHTASHVMAQAIKTLYPNAKLAIGPSIDNGFYYDVDFGEEFVSEADLPKIEAEMKKIVKKCYPMERFVLPRGEAIKFMQEKEEPTRWSSSRICRRTRRFPSSARAISPTCARDRTL